MVHHIGSSRIVLPGLLLASLALNGALLLNPLTSSPNNGAPDARVGRPEPQAAAISGGAGSPGVPSDQKRTVYPTQSCFLVEKETG